MSYYDVDWSPKFNFGRPRSLSGLVGVCIHTTENDPGTPAENVANYQITSESGSYNVLVDTTGKRLRENTDDWQVWATGNKGNDILLHISFVFRAHYSRAQWLAQEKMLRAGATVVAHWCTTYGFPVKQVSAAALPGITTHDATRVWGSTDHTDPGPNFPWDVFLRYVNEAMGTAPTAPTPSTGGSSVTTILGGVSAAALNDAKVAAQAAVAGLNALQEQLDQQGTLLNILVDQLVGPGRDKDGNITFSGWPQNGQDEKGRNLSTNDTVAAARRDIAATRAEIKSAVDTIINSIDKAVS